MRQLILIVAILFSTNSMAQIVIQNYTQDINSPGKCFPPNEVIRVEMEDDKLFFGGYTSNGGTYTLSDYYFTNINRGRFSERYDTPGGLINSRVTNTFENNVFSHTRTFFLSTRKNTLTIKFLENQMIINNKINSSSSIVCILNLE